jgi:hypothetical protein
MCVLKNRKINVQKDLRRVTKPLESFAMLRTGFQAETFLFLFGSDEWKEMLFNVVEEEAERMLGPGMTPPPPPPPGQMKWALSQ